VIAVRTAIVPTALCDVLREAAGGSACGMAGDHGDGMIARHTANGWGAG